MNAPVLDHAVRTLAGEPASLADYRGKVLLLVNVASQCGLTPQYAELQKLWERYRERGLVVLGVPCNDFGAQEPGSEKQIQSFCEVNYGVDFPLTAKAHVTGKDAHPFYKWAAEVAGEAAAPRWNFHKYLVGPDGELAAWFPTKTSPGAKDVAAAIEAALP